MEDLNRLPRQGYGFIYRYTFDNGKCYIGQTIYSVNDRTYFHKKNKRSQSIVDKTIRCGKKFSIDILAEVPTEILDMAERYCIGYFKTLHPDGYNLLLGGQTYREFSDEVRRRISVSNTGKQPWNKGKKMTDSQKKKTAEWHRKNPMFGENNPMYGKELTEQHKKKISVAHKRRFENDPELKRQISSRVSNYYCEHPEAKDYQRRIQRELKVRNGDTRRVICLETKEVFDSVADVQRRKGICTSSVTEALNGKRNQAGGYHWIDYTEDNLANTDEILRCLYDWGDTKDWLRSRKSRRVIADYRKTNPKVGSKNIRCIETGVIYESMLMASVSMGLSKNTLYSHMAGISKSVRGYHFERV